MGMVGDPKLVFIVTVTEAKIKFLNLKFYIRFYHVFETIFQYIISCVHAAVFITQRLSADGRSMLANLPFALFQIFEF